MDVKGALTRKFGPLPAWAWLLGAFAALYYYRKYKGGVASVGTSTASSVSDQTPWTPQDPVVLGPGESAYNPNNGDLVSGQPLPSDGSSGSSGNGTAPGPSDSGDGGSTPPGTQAPPPGHRPPTRHHRKRKQHPHRLVKPRKPMLSGKKRSPKNGHLSKPKPRTGSHLLNGGERKQQGHGRSRSFYYTDSGRHSGKPTGHNAVGGTLGAWRAPTAPGARHRAGLVRPISHHTEHQRPVASHPVPPRPHAAPPPPRPAIHDQARPRPQAQPRRVTRPRGRKK